MITLWSETAENSRSCAVSRPSVHRLTWCWFSNPPCRPRSSAPLGSQCGPDRVEIYQHRGPGCLERRFLGPEVAALACSVAMDEQAEEPLDPHPRLPQVVGEAGFSECLGSALSELLLSGDPDRSLPARSAALAKRAGFARLAGEAREPLALRIRALHARLLALRAGDGARLEVDLKLALRDPLAVARGGRVDRREHLDLAIGQLFAHRSAGRCRRAPASGDAPPAAGPRAAPPAGCRGLSPGSPRAR